MVRQAFETVRGGAYSRPRTVLGFFGTVLAVTVIGAIGISTVLARNEKLHWLIPWILIFAGFLIAGLIIGVFLIIVRDPTRLMLGEMSGREFVQFRRLTMGDSQSGEHLETMRVNDSIGLDPQTVQGELPEASNAESTE